MKNKIFFICLVFTALVLAGCDRTNKVIEGPFITKHSKLYSQNNNRLVTGLVQVMGHEGKLLIQKGYKNGLQHGAEEWFYDNGQLMRIYPYLDGKKHGLYQSFSKSGRLTGEGVYINGLAEGVFEYHHDSGELMRKLIYKNNLINGEVKTYYSNGNLAIEEFFIDDKLEGIRKDFNLDGSPRTIQEYKNGEKEGQPECIRINASGVKDPKDPFKDACVVYKPLKSYEVK
jgi:antitoxin component YwqK of YwqJK toxin-antitoxin module